MRDSKPAHPGYDHTTRGTAIFVGLMFLTATMTFAVGNALVLEALTPQREAPDTSQLALGVLLQAGCAVAVTAIGAALLRVLGRFHRRLAFAHFAVRALEGLVIVAMGAFMLTTKTLINYEPIIYAFTGVAGLIFTAVLLRTGLVPSWLARLGLLGYAAILAVPAAEALNIASLDTFPGVLLYVPGGLFELFLPILLIARGFRRPSERTAYAADEPDRALAVA